MRRSGLITIVAAMVLGATTAAVAQTYPSKAIQLVIPYPPGGSEALGRKIAATMSKNIGQPIVINNIAGASTQIASLKVKEAKPDGYTMYVSSPPELATGPAFYANLASCSRKGTPWT